MNGKILLKLVVFCFLLILGSGNSYSQDKNWTHFRGSNLNGISSAEKIPLIWADPNIKWKTEIHDRGHSSPVVFENQIWVTTATTDGKELYAVCLDYETGKIIYDIKVFEVEDVIGKHGINTYASPTPCIEKGFVYVHFGSLGTACLRTSDGSIVWKRTDLKCNHVQGPGSSPVLYKNLLILHYEGTDVRYIVALDKATGKQVWRTDRPAEPYVPLTQIGKKAYVTPLIINVKGRDLLISNGSAVCCAYDPLTGEEVWKVVRGAESTVPMPVAEKGVVYFYTGSMNNPDGSTFTELIAVNPDGKGDITGTSILWKKHDDQSQTQISSPVIKDGLIYTITSRNILMCIDASTGTEVWSERLRVNHNASPIFASGNVWFFSIKGEVLAVKAGRNYNVITQFQMDSGIWATPAFLRNSVILRTEKYICRIGE
ncbi:MAG: PQQ-binding-like beta-propeller repeat protein [Bacteroidia bacterium]|nr:PQQ-binding-like beta-propeller repeat protein [Bacteroidia bacterium]